jgi:hypothetical protein
VNAASNTPLKSPIDGDRTPVIDHFASKSRIESLAQLISSQGYPIG